MVIFVKILFIILIVILFTIIFAFLGLKLDNKDVLKKQLNIYKNKGFNIDNEFIGKGICKFNIYIDNKKKELLFYNNGKLNKYKFSDISEYKNKISITFKLKDKYYEVDNNPKYNNKYDELCEILDIITKVDSKKKKSKV